MRVSNCGYDYRHGTNYIAERPEGSEGHIIMIIRSPARILLNGQEHFTKGNCVVIYHMNTPQYYYANHTEFVNDWVRFILDDKDLAFWESTGIQFDTIQEYADVYPLSRLIKIMATEKWSANHHAEDSAALLLRLLLMKLSDYHYRKPIIYSEWSDRLTILRNNIYSKPELDWSIKNICKSLAISPSYLQHKYKKLFGNSIKNDITASRIDYSQRLLTKTKYTVSAISRMVGYENDMTFMYIFKKKTGLTPSQYRNSSATYLK